MYRSLRRVGLVGALLCALLVGAAAGSAHAADIETDTSQEETQGQTPASRLIEILDDRRLEELDSDEVSALASLLAESGSIALQILPDGTLAEMSPASSWGFAPLAVPEGTCEATTQGLWLRASSGYTQIGTKPTSECYHAAQYMRIATQFQAKHWWGYANEGGPKVGQAWNTHKYTNTTSAQTPCANTLSTWWRATNEHYIIDYAGCPILLYSATGAHQHKCGHQ